MRNRREKLRRLALTGLLLVLSVALCFVAFEYSIARFYYSNVLYIQDKQFDETLGWRLRPGTYWIKPPQTFRKHTVYVNRYGLRNADISPDPGDGTRKVLVLGDSFAFGKVIPGDQVFPRHIERNLNESSPRSHTVINAGIPGYGTAQQLLLLKKLSDEGLVADIYLITMFTNDILDNLRLGYRDLSEIPWSPRLGLDDNGDLAIVSMPQAAFKETVPGIIPARDALRSPKTFAVLGLAAESFMQTRPDLIRLCNKMGLRVDFPYVPSLVNAWYLTRVLDEGVPLMRAILAEAQSESTRRGARLLVSLIPSALQVYPETYAPMLERTFPDHEGVAASLADPRRPQRIVSRLCAELGIPFLDLLPILYDNNHEQLYIPREGHFSREGHKLVGRALAGFVVSATSDESLPQGGN